MESSKVAPHLHFSLPRYPMPVFKIGRLAVRRTAAGRGIGRGYHRFGFALIPPEVQPQPMFVAMGTIRDSLP